MLPAPSVDWFDELDLRPDAHPVAMGTRALGARPWLVGDSQRDAYLATKADLLTNARNQVLHVTEHGADAAEILAGLVGAASGNEPAIERAARVVQEDLCLLQRRDDGWYLDTSCVCFPTRWHLPQKVGHHIAAVHGPVDGYDPRITGKVDRLFDQIGERPVWRRNWFLMTDPTLYQPDRPAVETIVDRAKIHTDMFIRSERQTLRQVTSGWVVFTIRIQQHRLGDLLTTEARADSFARWVDRVPPELGERRHLTGTQRRELLAGLMPSFS